MPRSAGRRRAGLAALMLFSALASPAAFAAGDAPEVAQAAGAVPGATPENPAAPEAKGPPDEKADGGKYGTLSFVLENDLFADLDQHYTNGVRLSWLTAPGEEPAWAQQGARWLPMFANAKDIRVEYALGQSMYAPRDIERVDPDPKDRPFAGWLYGSVGVIAESDNILDQLSASVGVVGPAALGEPAQKFFHELIDTRKPRGWHAQLRNEPTLQFTYQRSWRAYATAELFGFSLDATPHAGAAIGNVFDYVNTGLTLRFGRHLPDDYGPPRVQPSLPGSGFYKADRFGWYLFAGVDGRAVAHNMFLDGNTFADSRSVDRRPLVGDFQAGIAVVVGSWRFAYTHVLRSREFEGQETPDKFGAFSVSAQF